MVRPVHHTSRVIAGVYDWRYFRYALSPSLGRIEVVSGQRTCYKNSRRGDDEGLTPYRP